MPRLRAPGDRWKDLLLVGGALFALALLLGPALTGPLFSDDWEFALENPARHAVRALVELHPYKLYRPLQLWMTATSQATCGDSTLPVHLMALVLHGLLMGLCLTVSRSISGGGRPLAVTIGYLTLSQLNAPALGGNDTLSLVIGTLAGSAALWWLHCGATRQNRVQTVLSLGAFAVALLGKESSLGYLPPLLFIAMGWHRRERPGRSELWPVVPSIAFVLIALAYVGWRDHLGADGPQFGGANTFRLGANLPANAALLAFGALTPVSTLAIFTGLKTHIWLPVALGTLGAGLVGTTCVVGIASRWRGRGLGLAVGLAASLLAPVLPLNHVSELYGYALLPLVAITFGLGTDVLLRRLAPFARHGAKILLLLVLCANGLALVDHARRMAWNGRQAARLMPELLRRARSLPLGGHLTLVNPLTKLPAYSLYRMNSFRLCPPEEVYRLSGRPDLKVTMVDSPPSPGEVHPLELRLTLSESLELTPL